MESCAIFPLRDSGADDVSWDLAAAETHMGSSNSGNAESSFEVATYMGVRVGPFGGDEYSKSLDDVFSLVAKESIN